MNELKMNELKMSSVYAGDDELNDKIKKAVGLKCEFEELKELREQKQGRKSKKMKAGDGPWSNGKAKTSHGIWPCMHAHVSIYMTVTDGSNNRYHNKPSLLHECNCKKKTEILLLTTVEFFYYF